MSSFELPSNADLVPIVVAALKAMGGSGTNDEMRTEVIKIMNLGPETVNKIHSGSRTELEYKLAWARTLAKQMGLIVNAGRMSWKVI